MAYSLGADQVIDYTREHYTRSGQRYDLLLDIAGSRAWRDNRRVLKPDSTYVIAGAPKSNRWLGPISYIIRTRLAALGSSQKVVFFIAQFRREDFLYLIDMIENGQVKPVVEKTYPLEEISAAMRHLGAGHAKGKIVVVTQ